MTFTCIILPNILTIFDVHFFFFGNRFRESAKKQLKEEGVNWKAIQLNKQKGWRLWFRKPKVFEPSEEEIEMMTRKALQKTLGYEKTTSIKRPKPKTNVRVCKQVLI